MGQFIDEDRRGIVARLVGQPGWEESQPMIYTTGPAPLGVESAMPDRRPYIPAGCDQQGRVKDGARAADICAATDKAISDWATLPAERTSSTVEPLAWLGAGVVFALIIAAGYALGRVLGAWA